MSLPFYFDRHVPAAIGRALRLRGVEVFTAYEDGSDRLEDEPLLLRATALFSVEPSGAGMCLETEFV